MALGKRVALKFIDIESAKNPEGVRRFIREARAASAIESSHIVQVFDVGELADGRPYIVMELLRGENLGTLLQRTQRLSVEQTLHIAEQVLRGLHRAHAKGVIHRDLKPDNIFLVKTDSDPMFAKVVDFGISKVTRNSKTLDPSTITREGIVLGTPFYMAPEQAQAVTDLDERADLWSLGAIMYECLSGKRPFQGDTYEQVIIAICTKSADNLCSIAPTIPREIVNVIMRALARDRDHRFSSAAEFARALHNAAPGLALVPSAFDLAAEENQPLAQVDAQVEAQDGPRTDVSWSAGQQAIEGAPVALSKTTKLALAGGVTAFLAFALTVGVVRYLQPAGGQNPSSDHNPPSSEIP
ncbi:MAG: serine/threonine protein kinase, partial [Sorangium cellulosum]